MAGCKWAVKWWHFAPNMKKKIVCPMESDKWDLQNALQH